MKQKNTVIIGTVMLVCFFTSVLSEMGCPYDKQRWSETGRSERKKLIEAPSLSGMERDCVFKLAERVFEDYRDKAAAADIIIEILRQYCMDNGKCKAGLFMETVSLFNAERSDRISEKFRGLWIKISGPYDLRIDRMVNSGMYMEADTLFRLINSLDTLKDNHLLEWLRIKGVIKDYESAAKLSADISSRGQREGFLSRNRLSSILKDAPEVKKEEALDIFMNEYTQNMGAERCAVFDWYVRICYRFGLYKREIEAIRQTCASRESKGLKLLNTGTRLFRDGKYSLSSKAAGYAMELLHDGKLRQRCAMLLYRSYIKLGRNDSALVWYEKLDHAQKEGAPDEAVVFLQKAGMLDQADSIIGSMPASVRRDTLKIRQYIFSDSLNKAFSYSKSCRSRDRWNGHESDAVLWFARTSLYSGKLAEFNSAIRDAQISPDWHGAQELLYYKCRLDDYISDAESFRYFGLLGLALFKDRPEDISATIDLTLLGRESRYIFAADLVEVLIKKEKYEQALKVLSFFPKDSEEPGVIFFRGLSKYMSGDYTAAGKLFKRLILMDHQDIYSKKAREFIKRIEEQISM